MFLHTRDNLRFLKIKFIKAITQKAEFGFLLISFSYRSLMLNPFCPFLTKKKPQFNFWRKPYGIGVIHIYPRGCKLTKRVTLEEACFWMLVVFIILLTGCGIYLQFLLTKWDLKLFKLFHGFRHLHGKAFCWFPCWYFSLTHSMGSDKPRGGVIAKHRKSKYMISDQLHKSRQMHNLFAPVSSTWVALKSEVFFTDSQRAFCKHSPLPEMIYSLTGSIYLITFPSNQSPQFL